MGDITTSHGNNHKTVCTLCHTVATNFFDTNRFYFVSLMNYEWTNEYAPVSWSVPLLAGFCVCQGPSVAYKLLILSETGYYDIPPS